jgi:hypothetical protein
MFRHASLLPLTFLLVFGGCAYLFPSCATIPGCPDGQFLCTNLNCSDPFTDPYNCGGCAENGGQICGAGMICNPDGGRDGGPGCTCGAQDETMIGGACYALRIDPQNCGTVGHVCTTNHICFDGGCTCANVDYLVDGGVEFECPVDAGETVCADLQSDPDNCGVCGTVCGGACAEGSCVALDAGLDGGADAGLDGGEDAGESDAGDGG